MERLLKGVGAIAAKVGGSDGGEKPRICKPGGSRGTVFSANPLGESNERFKSIFYGFLLLYSFVGVSIVADMFMAAIERITSKKRRIGVFGAVARFRTTNVWNETVANLTLMALGSSAPEILLAINDIFKNKFHAGDLGPSTIVGSAAFNLFVIVAVCINAVPSGETRQIKETGVFFITAVFSVFAYIWLVIIVQVNSPDVVSIMEGTLTFLFFPVLVWTSYAEDAGMFERWLNGRKKKDHAALEDDPGSPKQHGHHEAGHHHGGKHNDADPQEHEEEVEDDEQAPLVCVFLEWFCGLAYRCFSKLCSCLCCICRRCRRKKGQHGKLDEQSTDDEEVAEAEVNMEDPDYVIMDEEEGVPIENETGIISFKADSMEVVGNLEENVYEVTVLRLDGTTGRISCKYRMEQFSAIPGYDYIEEEGTLDFKNGVSKATFEITILPKRKGEKPDQFQIILEEPTNDAIFNPNSDGGEDSCLLMVSIQNANPPNSRKTRLYYLLDKWFNMDEMRQGCDAWYDQVIEKYYCNGSAEAQEEAKFLDWVMHILFFPWSMIYSVATPPPPFLGGWVCFCVSLGHIGCLTAVIGDMAELFGCVVGIADNITAISVVALGTSVPDLFASKTAATQDEWADASIVNVTGSNSVNVFLGIGVPWMAAAIYWSMVDGSQDEEWMRQYADEYLERCPQGCFVVKSGDLTFSVIVFTIGAMVALLLIRVRRVIFDGELGGPAGSDSKACSSFLMMLLWVVYIALSVWKSVSKTESALAQVLAILICVPLIMVLMAWFGAMLSLLRVSKEYIGEEGFFGVAIAVTLLSLRTIYFFMFE